MTPPELEPDTVAFTAPLSVWRTERYGDMGYVVIAGAAADALGAHELARRLDHGRSRSDRPGT